MKRGSLITKGYYEKLNKSNEEIERAVKENKDEFQRPVSAFITFET